MSSIFLALPHFRVHEKNCVTFLKEKEKGIDSYYLVVIQLCPFYAKEYTGLASVILPGVPFSVWDALPIDYDLKNSSFYTILVC